MDVTVIVVVVVLTALIFDFTNGFHDTANAMATSIATGALRPKVAVALAGCLNLAGAFLSVAGREDDLGRARRRDAHQPGGDLRGTGRGDPVEPDDLVPRPALQLVARAVRRPDRRDLGGGRSRRHPLQHGAEQGHPARRALARGRRPDRHDRDLPGLAGHRPGRARPRPPGVQARSDGLLLDARPGPRHQRRAEDHGRDHPDPDHLRTAGTRLGPAVLGRAVRRAGDRAGHLHGRLADHPDAGQAGQRHPARRRASPPRRPAPR